jgi:hypothetical protein
VNPNRFRGFVLCAHCPDCDFIYRRYVENAQNRWVGPDPKFMPPVCTECGCPLLAKGGKPLSLPANVFARFSLAVWWKPWTWFRVTYVRKDKLSDLELMVIAGRKGAGT